MTGPGNVPLGRKNARGRCSCFPCVAVRGAAQIWFTDTSCTNGPVLNDGGVAGQELYARFLIWNGVQGTFMRATNVNAGGFAISAPQGTGQSISDSLGGCSAYANPTNISGWPLTAISRAAAGIPSAISQPITVQ